MNDTKKFLDIEERLRLDTAIRNQGKFYGGVAS